MEEEQAAERVNAVNFLAAGRSRISMTERQLGAAGIVSRASRFLLDAHACCTSDTGSDDEDHRSFRFRKDSSTRS